MKKYFTLVLFFLATVFILIPTRAFAESNFTTDYAVTYNVMENATTHVTFDITLTNKTVQYYASSYTVQVGFENIKNILAKDSAGQITPQITKGDNNSIKVDFNDKVVGLDKKLNFEISFDTSDIVQKSGKIWDINIPGLTDQDAYNSFNVNVVAPKYLGSPSYIKPETGKAVGNNLFFTKEELGDSGISIAFGQEQIYSFELLYHLANPNLFPIKTEIALPMSTNYQDVQISNIHPQPRNVTIDQDGNWLAQYVLSSGKKTNISVKGYSRIRLVPKKQPESDEKLKDYLKEQPYWEINNKDIKDLALKLKTPHAIFQYVVEKLTYDFNRVKDKDTRIGALGVLKNPDSAVCLEFTDLFIALARAANIPAREVNGFAYTQNSKERPVSLVKDILHAWPEYYDYGSQAWIMVDPTWTNTTGGVDYFHKLDFDHFAFVIQGVNSEYPVPAGGYKTVYNQTVKDINVNLSDEFPSQIATLSLFDDFPNSYFTGVAPQGNIEIRNIGHVISDPQKVQILTKVLKPLSQTISFGEIPPFGHIEIPVEFQRPSFLTNKNDQIRITINNNNISKNIKISPFILNRWTAIGGIILAGITVTIFFIAVKTRNLLFSKRKEEDSLYRQGEKS